jgi:hypothetical protein
LTAIFPILVAVLEFCAGVVYAWSWYRGGGQMHGLLALVWLFYGVAAAALAMVGEQ